MMRWHLTVSAVGVMWCRQVVYNDLSDLEDAVREVCPELCSKPTNRIFDTSCFSGKYVTGDINDAYFTKVASERSEKSLQEKNRKHWGTTPVRACCVRACMFAMHVKWAGKREGWERERGGKERGVSINLPSGRRCSSTHFSWTGTHCDVVVHVGERSWPPLVEWTWTWM